MTKQIGMRNIRDPMQERYSGRSDSGAVDLLVVGKRLQRARDRTGSRRGHYVIHVVFAGHGYVRHNGEDYRVGPGDMFAIFPDDPQGPYGHDPEDPWQYYWVGLNGTACHTIMARAGFTPQRRILRAEVDPTTIDILERMLGFMRNPQHGSDLHANALLMEMLAHLVDRYGSRLEPHLARNDTIERAKAFMGRYRGAGITTQDVAAHVGYERTYLSAMFRRETGQTISSFLQTIRNDHARDLLRTMDISIQTVAQAVGFNSYRSFTRWFKRHNTITPSEFAKQERQQQVIAEATIRPIQSPAEIESVAELARKIWYTCYAGMITTEQIEYMLHRMYDRNVIEKEITEGIHYDVLELAGKIIGYTSYGPADDDGDLMLHKLYVDPNHQRGGHGSRMLRYVEDHARANGYTRIILRVNRNNTRGVPAYRKNGYKILRTDVADIGGGYVMDDYVMGKCLT